MISRNKNNIWPQNHLYKRFFKGFYTQKVKANITTNAQVVSNHRRRKG
jgi:hypothetical protein